MTTGLQALLWFVLLAMQSPVPPAAQDASPAIKTTRSVQVSVFVQNRQGEPVTDLKKEDFVLYDQGEEQTVRSFTVQKYQRPLPAGAPPAGTYNNRIDAVQPMPNALTVILLDGLNTIWDDRSAAKQGLLQFLHQLQPGDQVAIYTLDNGLHVLHDINGDRAALLRTLDHRPSLGAALLTGALGADTGDPLDLFLDRSGDKANDFYKERPAETTLHSLTAIASHLAGMPGRKNLIWVSDGFPKFLSLDYLGLREEARQAAAAISATGLAIYPVDAQALVPGASASRLQDAMKDLAAGTGGRAFLNAGDAAGSLRRTLKDGSFTYTLTFTPSHQEWNGKFREIKVEVNRPAQLGLEAHYRQGYVTTPEFGDDLAVRKASLEEAVASPLLFTGLGMTAKLLQAPTAEMRHARFRIVMETGDLSFGQDAHGLWIANIDIATVVHDAQNQTLRQLVRTMHVSLKQDRYDEFRKNGLGMSADIDAPDGTVGARLVVRDLSSGTIGSVDLPFAPIPEVKQQ